MTYKISALIVTYNRPSLLLRCIDSLLQQTCPLDSVIIVDNGSLLDTEKALLSRELIDYISFRKLADDEYLVEGHSKGVDINYIKIKANKGPGFAFKRGLEYFSKVDSDWIILMDDDGYPSLDCVHKLTKYTDCYDFLNPLVLNEDDHNQLAFGIYHSKLKRNLVSVKEIEKYVGHNVLEGVANPFNGTFISSKLINSIGLPMAELYGWGVEVEYELRALSNGFKIATVCNSFHYHPKSRLRKVEIFRGRISLFQNEDRDKNYIDLRNRNYIWFTYFGLNRNIKFLIAYVYFYVTRLDFRGLLSYFRAFYNGINSRF